MRRQELAQRAGLSVEYVTRLEQGRASNPSAQVVTALAAALSLTAAETASLFTAAGLNPPERHIARQVPESIERLLHRLADLPAAVYSAD